MTYKCLGKLKNSGKLRKSLEKVHWTKSPTIRWNGLAIQRMKQHGNLWQTLTIAIMLSCNSKVNIKSHQKKVEKRSVPQRSWKICLENNNLIILRKIVKKSISLKSLKFPLNLTQKKFCLSRSSRSSKSCPNLPKRWSSMNLNSFQILTVYKREIH